MGILRIHQDTITLDSAARKEHLTQAKCQATLHHGTKCMSELYFAMITYACIIWLKPPPTYWLSDFLHDPKNKMIFVHTSSTVVQSQLTDKTGGSEIFSLDPKQTQPPIRWHFSLLLSVHFTEAPCMSFCPAAVCCMIYLQAVFLLMHRSERGSGTFWRNRPFYAPREGLPALPLGLWSSLLFHSIIGLYEEFSCFRRSLSQPDWHYSLAVDGYSPKWNSVQDAVGIIHLVN